MIKNKTNEKQQQEKNLYSAFLMRRERRRENVHDTLITSVMMVLCVNIIAGKGRQIESWDF